MIKIRLDAILVIVLCGVVSTIFFLVHSEYLYPYSSDNLETDYPANQAAGAYFVACEPEPYRLSCVLGHNYGEFGMCI